MMRGNFNSGYFIGVMPDGNTKWFCTDSDYWEEYEEIIKEKDGKLAEDSENESVVA